MSLIIVAVVVGIPALYVLYALFVTLHLLIEARGLRRACAARDLRFESKLFFMGWDDLEDPVNLTVVVRSKRSTRSTGREPQEPEEEPRRFSFTLFRSLLDLRFVSVRVESVVLAGRLRGRVSLERRATSSRTLTPLGDDFEEHTFGVPEIDARFRLSDGKAEANTPEAMVLVRNVLTNGSVLKALDAYGGSLMFSRGLMTIRPGENDGAAFVDGLAKAARLADALDDAVTTASPYR